MYVDGTIPRMALLLHRLRALAFELFCAGIIVLCLAGIVLLHLHVAAGRIVVGRLLPIALLALLLWPGQKFDRE